MISGACYNEPRMIVGSYNAMNTTYDKIESQPFFDEYVSEASRAYLKNPSNNNDVFTPTPIISVFDKQTVRNTFRSMDWDFTESKTSYLTHDIHPYPAKFIPQIPAQIIRALSYPGDYVWDPFGGCGTTALEALLNNRTCVSTDINPIGEIVGRAKTTTLTYKDEVDIERFIKHLNQFLPENSYLRNYIEEYKERLSFFIPSIPNIKKWFSSSAICELAFIKYMISSELSTTEAKNVAYATFSKIVTKVSNQDSETRYSAVDKGIAYGQTLKIFLDDLNSNFSKIKAMSRTLGYRTSKFYTADVMDNIVGDDKPIKDGEVDLIVTSPPYPNAFDYHLYHRFRIFWLDGNPLEMSRVEIGSHLRYQKQKKGFSAFEDEMKAVLQNCYKALKHGRYIVLVLGDAIFEGKIYKTADRIGSLSKQIGFDIVDSIDRTIHASKRSVQNVARRAKEEQLLILQKPIQAIPARLMSARYKLWPYEAVISELESLTLLGTKYNDSIVVDPKTVIDMRKLTFYHKYLLESSSFPTWQSILENGDAEKTSSRKDPKYVTHGIHPYKGKFYPQLVRPLLNILKVSEGDIVFDPFCGSGTVALESTLNGYKAYGCDINPLAIDIAKAKNEIIFVDPYVFDSQMSIFITSLDSFCDDNQYETIFNDDVLIEITKWFPSPVINKLAFIMMRINEVPDERIRGFIRVILSSIIRDVSQQDPDDLRIRRRKDTLLDAPVFELFLKKLLHQRNQVIKFAKMRNYAPNDILQPNIWLGNSKTLNDMTSTLSPNSVDCVITSPPYATALPYIDTNRLSLLVLNGLTAKQRVPVENTMTGTREISLKLRKEYEKRISEDCFDNITSPLAIQLIKKIYTSNVDADVGFRKKNMAALLYMYFNDLTCIMKNLHVLVKNGGHICIVIGDTKTTTNVETVTINTTEIIREIAKLLNWTSIHDIPISVTKENYKHINNSITENAILVFRKE